MSRHFSETIRARWDEGKFLCVGLDPDLEKIPAEYQKGNVHDTFLAFNTHIVNETHDIVCAYKPNSAFYEAHGVEGIRALKGTIQMVHTFAPKIPVILDAKRADLENTNRGYVQGIFDELEADAVTVHPYIGAETLQPFLARADKGVIVLCRTSNPGAKEFQDLLIDGEPLYMRVAKQVETWNTNNNCMLVVGATYPEEMANIRAAVPNLPFLIPGVGAQGGDLEASVHAAKDAKGLGFIIATSRAVIYAQSPREEAQKLHSAISKALLE